jgi:Do/DeqQ family serine protease
MVGSIMLVMASGTFILSICKPPGVSSGVGRLLRKFRAARENFPHLFEIVGKDCLSRRRPIPGRTDLAETAAYRRQILPGSGCPLTEDRGWDETLGPLTIPSARGEHMLRHLVLSLALLGAAPALAAFPLENQSGVPSVAPVLRKVTPGVVNIAVRGRVRVNNPLLADPFFRRFFNIPNGPVERETQASGSGVIVDARNGYVLTNNHVVQNADLIEVTLRDKRRFKAKLVGRDEATDVAVLKIPAEALTDVPMGDSDKSEVGDFVLAIGNPFGLGQTVTSGIVSAIGRSGLGIEGYEDFIQTDAPINPGNSGGALVDLNGQLIGINTAILAPAGGNVGVGFAVPINMARTVMDQIIRYGHVDRGWIGVGGQDITPDLMPALKTTSTDGAVISEVQPGSPADRSGLRPGDIVLQMDGVAIKSWQQFLNRIALSRVDQQMSLTVERSGKSMTVPVKVAPRPQRQRAPDPDEQ